MLIDVHAHLADEEFTKDLGKVIERARKADVKAIITNGSDHKTNVSSLKIAEKYDIVKAALGIYPLYAVDLGLREAAYPMEKIKPIDIDNELKFIEENKDKLTAIGEIGLDYTVKGKEKEQKEVFQKIIRLAEKIKKPIIVHSRKAEDDVIEMLNSSKIKKVLLHCFSGKKNIVKKAADLGYHFSIPTNVVRAQNFQLMVKEININQLFCETDAPYLSPFKDRRNEPAFVIESYKKMAEIKGMELQEVINNVWMNFQRLFL
ncbi:TatD family hydrolase [Candidatus Woesearchaeota archaeon]|nr:TatD family hydrolase [Candidatus Woesearchaeota archaeon]